ncbi:hypothetical protein PUV54_14285 [Hyphococcus flavus]|uniref:Uncharacterized protein n=1 Tax=Hyphococcus flavus TaxID=1866326 RepID=A0AAF0CBJ5_9PROT|nr:hypothetical protein [Hyphococcus flavus]WDI31120.1 hypothetical protein PUV54_14285 [Hyphococcus flavus]
MLLRRMTEHVKAQNWLAVGLDFLIVVFGILIAFQINNWSEGRQRDARERAYLERLHTDIVELADRRARYDLSRPITVEVLKAIVRYTNGYDDDLDLSEVLPAMKQGFPPGIEATPDLLNSFVCNSIEWSAYLTLPPAELPTATELISAGQLDQIEDEAVKLALLSYLQQVSRTKDHVAISQRTVVFLANQYPDLIKARYNSTIEFGETILTEFTCDYKAMRKNTAFLNALNINFATYSDYTNVSVLPVSERLSLLHEEVDKALSIDHGSDAD